MNKIVINVCYGGFSLSRKACQVLADQGVECAAVALDLCKDEGFFHYRPEVARHDPRLVKVVEDMGERANGSCADLRVIDLGETRAYRIHEYDGKERFEVGGDDWTFIP